MATKMERIDREIQKTREKIAEYQEKLKTLEAQKTEAENLEIDGARHADDPGPAERDAVRRYAPRHGSCLR